MRALLWGLAATVAASGAAGGAARAQDAPAPGKTGPQLYRQLCSHCHGFNMVNPGTSSYDLRRFPVDQQDRFVASVMNGKNTMPAWGGELTADELDKLWDYVRSRGKS